MPGKCLCEVSAILPFCIRDALGSDIMEMDIINICLQFESAPFGVKTICCV